MSVGFARSHTTGRRASSGSGRSGLVGRLLLQLLQTLLSLVLCCLGERTWVATKLVLDLPLRNACNVQCASDVARPHKALER